MEIACLVWAHVLLDMVYRFIEKDIALQGAPPYSIPDMHFAEAALAIEDSTAGDGKEAHTFLLEEVIRKSEGGFRKYLNNVSPAPLSPSCGDDVE
ncbi:hypothetical protein C0993_004824, partial [Termitomyces sp. T159_Od127]